MNQERVLDGVRVIDFTRFMAGPYATIVLSDHGADVIKIESLPDGDPSRQSGVDYVGDENALYLMWNRGKRSVALDLRRAEALPILHRLIRSADVLIENYRPGVADEIGIGYEAMSDLNPRLVYCSVTAFGSVGPMATYPGTDPIVQAASGVMSVTGERGGQPVLVGVPAADFTGSILAVQAIAFALLGRERTGRGQHVEVSMLDGVLTMLSTRLASYWTTSVTPGPEGSAHSTLIPLQAFRTADDWVMAGTFGADSWPRFCQALDMPELATDARFGTNLDRQQHREALLDIVADAFLIRSCDEWERRFRAAGALFARVNTIADILADPHVRESGLVQTVEHATVGPIPQLGPPIRMSEHQPRISLPPPVLGEHTREVLASAGYQQDEIEAFVASGVALDAGRGVRRS